VKAILCEKPIAPDSAAADRMIAACAKEGVLLAVNHERRFEDRYLLCRRLIKEGFLGTLRTVTGHVLTNVPYGQKSFAVNGTSLMHDGTHLFDIIHFLCGRPEWVEGFVHDKRKEVITAVMKLVNGANVFVEAGGMRKYFSFELDLQGTDGRILIGNTHFRIFKKRKSRHYSGFFDLAELPLPKYVRKNYFTAEAEEIVRRVKGRPRGPFPSSGRDGLLALQVIEAVFASLKNDGERVRVR
jgi:predicted dehydrogenase